MKQTSLFDLIDNKLPYPGEKRYDYINRMIQETKIIDDLGNTDWNERIEIHNSWTFD